MESNLNYLQPASDAGTTAAVARERARVVALGKIRESPLPIPSYLRETYNWTYLNPRNVRLLDNEVIVSLILWGQHRRLQKTAFSELKAGQRVLQPAAVYGDFSQQLATHIGVDGHLEVSDIAPIQVETTRLKLQDLSQVSTRQADARNPGGAPYDAVCCYFLLHEMPDEVKNETVDALLASVIPGGKVVFVDYHKPHWANPLKAVMSVVYDTLEPFAKGLWHQEIEQFATDASDFTWRKDIYFGGLYQKVVAERKR